MHLFTALHVPIEATDVATLMVDCCRAPYSNVIGEWIVCPSSYKTLSYISCAVTI